MGASLTSGQVDAIGVRVAFGREAAGSAIRYSNAGFSGQGNRISVQNKPILV